MVRGLAYWALLALIMLMYPRPVSSGPGGEASACVKLLFVEQTVMINKSNKTLNISSMPAFLYFDYPQKAYWQRVLEIEVYWNSMPANYSLERSLDGDLSLRVRPLQAFLKPGESINITVGYVVWLNSSARKEWQPPVRPMEALNATSLWNYSNPFIREAYVSLSPQEPFNETRYLYRVLEWFDEHLAYRSRVPARHPWEVLEERMGDCDDRSNLLVTLLRAGGIPAYTEFGFLVIPGYVLTGSAAGGFFKYRVVNGGPHAWVRAYVDGRWIVVDTTFYVNSTGLPSDHVVYSAYAITRIPVMVTGWVLHTDYVESDASTLSNMAADKLFINDTVEARILGEGCQAS